jgi:hypothetical protein
VSRTCVTAIILQIVDVEICSPFIIFLLNIFGYFLVFLGHFLESVELPFLFFARNRMDALTCTCACSSIDLCILPLAVSKQN